MIQNFKEATLGKTGLIYKMIFTNLKIKIYPGTFARKLDRSVGGAERYIWNTSKRY